ncbi:MAG: hypothetical protein M3Q75_01805, partial [Gemmatimonadota bacterium]|nr:hypothetical protein [Gemmatimonadota bacterium]
APAKGSWRRYVGKVGRVVTFNRQAKEYGLRFTADGSENATWFLASELTPIARPRRAPDIPLKTMLEASRMPQELSEGNSREIGS